MQGLQQHPLLRVFACFGVQESEVIVGTFLAGSRTLTSLSFWLQSITCSECSEVSDSSWAWEVRSRVGLGSGV